ncbi:MAG: hypothetical protein KGH76_05945 [Thaumarchaeota archaeon]|nr:hypothetical protein [Nitrososphaerota archaeon]MDE1842847.1 hypothetical protein [Nitrososphaerota archaeon]
MDKDSTIKKIDEIIMVLSKSKKQPTILTQDEVKAIQGVFGEDQQKLANRLEDLVVLLRDDPDNKRKIRETRQTAFDEFGHVPPVWSVLKSVESLF